MGDASFHTTGGGGASPRTRTGAPPALGCMESPPICSVGAAAPPFADRAGSAAGLKNCTEAGGAAPPCPGGGGIPARGGPPVGGGPP